jgi:hypothetical protein
MSEAHDGLTDSGLTETAAAMAVADRECLEHTGDEYAFPAVAAEALDHYRKLGEGGDLNAIAAAYAIQIVFALFNDVNL